MSLTLVTTAGSSDANAYCTLADATTFLEQNIHTYSTWSSASTANKNACIIWATRLLDDQMDWVGSKSDPLGIDPANQALRWPRQGVYDPDGDEVDEDTIPQFLVNATAEYASFLLASDRTADFDTYGFKELQAGPLKMVVDKYDRRPVMPVSVWEMVKFYGTRSGGTMRELDRI